MACQKCNGDGKRLLPIKNVGKVLLRIELGWVRPDYFTQVVDCECAKPKAETN